MSAPLPLPTNLLDGLRPGPTRVDGEVRSTIQQLEQLADRGNYGEAAGQAADLLRSHIYDLRLGCVYLMGLFMERGIAHLPPLLTCVARLVDDEGRAPAHVRARPRTIDTTLSWLFQTISTQIRFHAKQRDAVWSSWLSAEAELPERIAEGVDQVMGAAQAVLESPACAGALSRTRRWALKDLKRALARHEEAKAEAARAQEAPAPADDDAPEPDDEHAASNDPPDRTPETAPEPWELDGTPWPHEPEPDYDPDAAAWESAEGSPWDSPSEPPSPAPWGAGPEDPSAMGPPPPALAQSPALSSLRDKLEGFEVLVGRGDFARAAIVAHDVQQLIESFDPVTYLPSLFAGYFRAMSRHIEQLRPHLERGDDSYQQVLSRFYRADLQGFVSDE